MSPYSFPPLICVLFSIFFIVIIIKTVIDKTLKKLAISSLVSIIWWQGTWAILFSIHNDTLANILVRFGYSGIIFVAPFLAQFIYYSSTSKKSVFLKYVIYLSFLFLPFIWFSDLFISGAWSYSFGYYPKGSYLHLVHLFLVTVCIGYTFIYCLRNIKLKENFSQNKDALISLLLISVSVLDYLVNWGIEFYPFGWFSVLIGLLYMLYSILFSDYMNILKINVKQNKELQKAHDELEKKVAERTAEYKKAKEEADQVNQLKSEFLENMSHELRTPMHGILSFSKFGIDKIDKTSKEKNLNYFKKIKTAGDRLMGLLDNLLDLSKLESRKEVYKMETVNIWKVTKNAVSEIETLWKEKNLLIRIEDALMPIEIICDKQKIDQVIQNLLSNAVKYTPLDKHITISFKSGELSNGQGSTDKEMVSVITVSLKDEGVGIPGNELETIFDKFVQSSKTKTGAGGTGLGLAICKEIIDVHNGKIWAENNPEGGSIFSFMLPYDQETN